MNRTALVVAGFALALGPALDAQEADVPMTFFLTSHGPGDGANLGGLEGADAHCRMLAEEAGTTGVEWRAYLSAMATDAMPAVDARDRIGAGPWHNAAGALIARDVAHLHSNGANLVKETQLDEHGQMVNGRGDDPNRHDILTGSDLDGTVYVGADGYDNCANWTSAASDGSTRVGHHDRTGGGENPRSWNSAHGSRGCGQSDLRGTGGDGLFYCFGTPAAEPRGARR